MEITTIVIGCLLVIVIVSIFLIIRKRFILKKREPTKDSFTSNTSLTREVILENCSEIVKSAVISVSKLYFLSILNFANNTRKDLSQVKKDIKELNLKTSAYKKHLFSTIRLLQESDIESGHFYVQILDKVGDAGNCMLSIISPILTHIDNNHPPLTTEQSVELLKFNEKMAEFFNYSLNILKNNRFENSSELLMLRNEIVNQTIILKKNQIQYLKNEGKGTKVSLVFLEVMTESKNLVIFVTNALEAQKEFFEYSSAKM